MIEKKDSEKAAEQTGSSGLADVFKVGLEGGDLVKEAIAEIPEILEEMYAALYGSDFEMVQDRAHYLKNTIFALQMDLLLPSCVLVSERSREQDVEGARKALGDLNKAFDTWKDTSGY
ncbi:MAG: hypothetical protein JKY51_00230 [Opitutaceae bacterium]|nr:hypothetical protein [Opitutaceae bacterium]